MTIVIKNANIDDAKDIAMIQVKSWQTAYTGIMPTIILNSISVENYQDAWKMKLSQDCKVLIATEQDMIYGFASYGPCHDENIDSVKVAEISAMYLSPDKFRQGIGTRLCEATEAAACQSGFEELTIWVLDANRAAREFYEGIDFIPTGDAVAGNFEKVELKEILYRKPLIKNNAGA